MPMRVATYTRISTDKEHQPYSLEAQDVRLRALGGPQAKPAPQHAFPSALLSRARSATAPHSRLLCAVRSATGYVGA
jgi:hypothetical protein